MHNENPIITELELSYTNHWYDRALPLDSPAWKALRRQVIARAENRCSFCAIGLSKYLVVDHIDGNAQHNQLVNLRVNCPACDKIRHCGLAGINGQLEVWTSKLKQVEIVQLTHQFFLKHQQVPTPQQLDENAKQLPQQPFEVARQHFVAQSTNSTDSLATARGFFTKITDFSYLRFRINPLTEPVTQTQLQISQASSSEQVLLVGLNEQQRMAVLCQNSKICVVAGPGCGKTKTLITRISLLLQRGTTPHRLLILTFSKRAIKEIRTRIKNSLPTGGYNLNIFNLHGFCYHFLRKHIQHLAISKTFRICDQSEQTELVKKILREQLDLAKFNDSKEVSKICRQIALCKLRSIKNFGRVDFAELNEVEQAVAISYQNYLETNNCLDFTDLLLKTFLILSQNESIRLQTNADFDHLLLDEFQDINTIQWAIINLLTGRHTKLFLVGDPNQSIYGFQGSSPDLIRSLQQSAEWSTIYLNVNYRSSSQIVKLANLFVSEHPLNMLQNSLIPTKDEGAPVIFQAEAETEAIVNKIVEITANGVSYHDIAVVYRNNFLSRTIEQALVRAKIPYEILGSFKFIEREEIRDVLAYLRMFIYQDELATIRIISLVPKVGAATLKWLQELAQQQELTIVSCLAKHFTTGNSPLFSKKLNTAQLTNLINFSKLVQTQQKQLDNFGSIEQFLQQILVEFGYYEYLQNEEERALNVQQLFSILASWEAEHVNDNAQLLQQGTDFLNYLTLAFEDSQLRKSTSNLVLSTVHQVKGLEFKVVLFIHLDQDVIPDHRFNNSAAEEERVFYVGITRAQEQLYLVSNSQQHSTFLDSLQLTAHKDFSVEHKRSQSIALLETLEQEQPVITKYGLASTSQRGVVLRNSGFRRDKQNRTYCIITVLTKEADHKLFCWKKDLPTDKWLVVLRLKQGDPIKYKARSWSGGWRVTSLMAIQERVVWDVVEQEIANLKIAFLDIETTFSWRSGNEIVEIAYLIYQQGRLLEVKSWLVKPSNLTSLEIVNSYDNIRLAELAVAKDWAEMLLEIQTDLADCVLVSHNFKGFDYHCLKKAAFFRSGYRYYCFDTLAPARALMTAKDWEGKSDLQNLIRKIRADESFVERHRALPDAVLHKELFDYLVSDKQSISLFSKIHD